MQCGQSCSRATLKTDSPINCEHLAFWKWPLAYVSYQVVLADIALCKVWAGTARKTPHADLVYCIRTVLKTPLLATTGVHHFKALWRARAARQGHACRRPHCRWPHCRSSDQMGSFEAGAHHCLWHPGYRTAPPDLPRCQRALPISCSAGTSCDRIQAGRVQSSPASSATPRLST